MRTCITCLKHDKCDGLREMVQEGIAEGLGEDWAWERAEQVNGKDCRDYVDEQTQMSDYKTVRMLVETALDAVETHKGVGGLRFHLEACLTLIDRELRKERRLEGAK